MKFQIRSLAHKIPASLESIIKGGVYTFNNISLPYWYVEIETAEQMNDLRLKCKNNLILTGPNDVDDMPTIIIYDDYIE